MRLPFVSVRSLRKLFYPFEPALPVVFGVAAVHGSDALLRPMASYQIGMAATLPPVRAVVASALVGPRRSPI